MTSKQRFNISIHVQRGIHEGVTYMYTSQPVKPGKVDRVFSEAISDMMAHITRNGKHEGQRYMFGDDLFIGVSGGVLVMVKKELS